MPFSAENIQNYITENDNDVSFLYHYLLYESIKSPNEKIDL